MKKKIISLITSSLIALFCSFVFIGIIIVDPELILPIVFVGVTTACWIGNVIISIIEIIDLKRRH